MKLLAFECSAAPASVAVWEDGKILACGYVNVKITHSQTLIPMAQNVLNSAMLTLNDIDGFAISHGPGSFTGVRIGLAAVKGLAQPQNKPCYGVSTLAAMAVRFSCFEGYVCCLMDARRNQFYNALFKVGGGTVTRICPDRAEAFEVIEKELGELDGKVYLTGDGACLFYGKTALPEDKVILPNDELIWQNAAGVAMQAAIENSPLPAEKLLPVYLRPSQAERELKNK